MIANKKEFYSGAGMLVAFSIILILIFSPVFSGQNGLEYLDDLYNSISKGSAYYIPKLKKESALFNGVAIDVSLPVSAQEHGRQTAALFAQSGVSAELEGHVLKLKGDLGKILANCLTDTDYMYHNNGKAVAEKYNYDERRVLYNWWQACKAMDKALKDQKKFKEAKMVTTVKKKAVESSYNYYKIEPQKIGERLGIVIFSLIFYVIYTLWYGFAFMFMFEGLGMQLEH